MKDFCKWKDLSPFRKEFNKETKIIKQAQNFLEAQYVWKSVQRSGLFMAEAEVGSSKKKSAGVLTWRGVNRGSLVCEYGLNLPRLRWEWLPFPSPMIVSSVIPYLDFHQAPFWIFPTAPTRNPQAWDGVKTAMLIILWWYYNVVTVIRGWLDILSAPVLGEEILSITRMRRLPWLLCLSSNHLQSVHFYWACSMVFMSESLAQMLQSFCLGCHSSIMASLSAEQGDGLPSA